MESSAEPRLSLPVQAFAATFNHLLQSQPWSRERLQRHAGKTVQVNLPPLLLLIGIEASGMVFAVPDGAEPDATLGVSPLALLHMLSARPTPQELVHAAGDTTLALDFGNVMQHLRWDAEEDLSKIFGDVLGHRLARGGAGLLGFMRQAAENLSANLVEYWTEEQPLLVRQCDVMRFNQEVDELRDSVARLEKRISRLET